MLLENTKYYENIYMTKLPVQFLIYQPIIFESIIVVKKY
jgi:hypothetical protein